MVIAKNIRYLRLQHGMGQDELADRLGYRSFTTIQKWESGVSTPPLEVFIRMAEIFDVDLDEFARTDLTDTDSPKKYQKIATDVPVYGYIPAGVPLEAVEDIKDYIAISAGSASGSEYFALEVAGNSMYPKYEDGDVVLFEHMNVCENGDDCAVRLRGEDATFKKVRKLGQSVILQPINPEYDPIQIDASAKGNKDGKPDDGIDNVEILGVAREIRRKV